MYSPLNAQLIAAQQQEIARRAVHAHHRQELLSAKRTPSPRASRPLSHRLQVRMVGLFAVLRPR
jgi:hypothetical protein